MCTLILYREDYLSFMEEFVNESSNHNRVIMNIDSDVLVSNLLWDIKLTSVEDVLSQSELNDIGVESLLLSQNWYKTNGIDLTLHENLSFGKYIEYQIKGVMNVICRQVAFLDKIKPNKIFLVDDESLISNVTLTYANKRGIQLNIQKPDIKKSAITEWYGARKKEKKKNVVKDILKKLVCCMSEYLGVKKSTNNYFIQQHPHTLTTIDLLTKKNNHRVVCEGMVKDLGIRRRLILLYKKNTYEASKTFVLEVIISRLDAKSNKLGCLNFRDIEFWHLIKKMYLSEIANSWCEFSTNIFHYEQVFKKYSIDTLIVLHDAESISRLLVMIAKKNGIVSVIVSHGSEGFMSMGHSDVIADIKTYFGESCKQMWIKYTIPNHEVFRVSIGEDSLHRTSNRIQKINKNLIYPKLKINKNEFMNILFISDPYVNYWTTQSRNEPNKVLRLFCQSVSQLTGVNSIIRFHPSSSYYERSEHKFKIINYYKNSNIYIDKCLTIEESIAFSDVVVVGYSSVGLQAIAAGKPLVIFDPFKRDCLRYTEEKAGATVDSSEDLIVILNKLLRYPKCRLELCQLGSNFIGQRVLNYGDNKACERLHTAINTFKATRSKVME